MIISSKFLNGCLLAGLLFSTSAFSASLPQEPTFCKFNPQLKEELCFCIDDNCKMIASDKKREHRGHYMLCVNSHCEVANDTWEDCIDSTCVVGTNAIADCIKGSKCFSEKQVQNTSIICRPGNSCVVADPAVTLYCESHGECDFSPKNHKNIRETAAPIPFAYTQEYITSGEFRRWLDAAIIDYRTSNGQGYRIKK